MIQIYLCEWSPDFHGYWSPSPSLAQADLLQAAGNIGQDILLLVLITLRVGIVIVIITIVIAVVIFIVLVIAIVIVILGTLDTLCLNLS